MELYSSEGCSSCPPADAVLRDLQKVHDDKNLRIYCLGFHVDYWDSLGWKDRFSSADFTNRQRSYRNTFHSDSIYTPQMVVNGTAEFNGSNRALAGKTIEQALSRQPVGSLSLDARLAGRTVSVNAQLSESVRSHQLTVALVQKTASSDVKRGENAGRKLTHAQLVRQLQSSQHDSLGKAKLQLTIPNDLQPDDLTIIGFVQNTTTGEILAANELTKISP